MQEGFFGLRENEHTAKQVLVLSILNDPRENDNSPRPSLRQFDLRYCNGEESCSRYSLM